MSSATSFVRWLRLPAPRRRELAGALAVLLCAQMGLALLGFGSMRRIAGRMTAASRPAVGAQAVAEGVARAVAAAARHSPTRPTCLPRALALQWLLGRRGIASQLRLGVRKVDGRLDAHAWVESSGEPLIDGRAVRERFAVLTEATER